MSKPTSVPHSTATAVGNVVISGKDDTRTSQKKNGVGFGVLPLENNRDAFFDEAGGLGEIGVSERSSSRKRSGSANEVTKMFSNEDDEDTEMDGKQLSVSRSHPEISTASPSLEFGLLSLGMGSATNYSNAGSTDSLQEEQLAVGLSTVPNQFCSSREAMELKKLLILSKGKAMCLSDIFDSEGHPLSSLTSLTVKDVRTTLCPSSIHTPSLSLFVSMLLSMSLLLNFFPFQHRHDSSAHSSLNIPLSPPSLPSSSSCFDHNISPLLSPLSPSPLPSHGTGSRGGIVPSSTAVMDMYMVGKVVGVGSYGKVRAAWHRLTCAKVAIKTYDKAKLKDPAHWKRVHSEIKIMEQISHPRIARMYEAVETPKRMHLIMECLDGGNLCSYVKSKKRLSEDESSRIFFQILQAIEHLHLLGVTHRDVKLENVLFVDSKDCKDIKLIDFGFSTVCQQGRKLKVFCGTPSCE